MSCPLPMQRYPRVTLAHGGGGSLTAELIRSAFLDVFNDPLLNEGHDGARLPAFDAPTALSTDSHVVSPLFFPGGDIASLAVYGTVNDVAMCGADPQFLSLGVIIEEGLPFDTLHRVARSLQRAAARAGVRIVTGDTKVVERGKADGLFLNTTGIGPVLSAHPCRPQSIREGDAILLSGDVGRHGIAVLAARNQLDFETEVRSDCAPLNRMVKALFADGLDVHCLRDLTRGGLATALVELSQAARADLELSEADIPITQAVDAACELLGLDPLFVANEGACLCLLPESQADRALALMRRFAPSRRACAIGRVAKIARDAPQALLRTPLGTSRLLTRFSGEQLPRIC